MHQKSILLIAFHNPKALGVRYLEASLKRAGIPVYVVFFKGFNSRHPLKTVDKELTILKKIINELQPSLIGLSVMTSLYLETVYAVNDMIRRNFDIPIIWGGVYPTMFPDNSLKYADYVIRGEGEQPVVELTSAIFTGNGIENIQNLSYKSNGEIIHNDIRPLCQNLDEYGYPEIGGTNKFYINDGKLSMQDPMLNSYSYDITTSRGCPFTCSYCCSVNIKRIYKGKGKFVRFRSVDSCIAELNEAKRKMKNLKYIYFWDEIFPDDHAWIDEFAKRYKSEINLPFQIWCHPLKVDRHTIKTLVDCGLGKVVMGIQSGSPEIRKEIFHRNETQEDIINASIILKECKVPQVVYDFILQHPFETHEDIKKTYELCTKLAPPFELQLHGLNFLPGSDIVDIAIKKGVLTREELDKMMFGSMQEQYNMYWGTKKNDLISNFWYALIFMTQFKLMKPAARYFSKKDSRAKLATEFYRLLKPVMKLRYFYRKAKLIFSH